MTKLINTLTSTLSKTVLFAAGLVMAGLGFAVVGTLALFALIALGVAMMAAPFVSLAQTPDTAPTDADVEAAA